jgi:hypothetical protein
VFNLLLEIGDGTLRQQESPIEDHFLNCTRGLA